MRERQTLSTQVSPMHGIWYMYHHGLTSVTTECAHNESLTLENCALQKELQTAQSQVSLPQHLIDNDYLLPSPLADTDEDTVQ